MLQFHELQNEVTEVGDGDYAAVSNATNNTRKISGLNLKKQMAQNTLTKGVAPAFSTETAYAVGDLVIQDGQLYRCTTAHAAGAWASGHFTATHLSLILREQEVMLINMVNS